MPTRKQRRRRDKDFRHDVRVFEVDEEGNEVPIAELRARSETGAKGKPAPGKGKQRAAAGRGPVREVQPPSWHRAFRRGGLMGALMLVAFVFVFKSGSLAVRLGWGVFYAVAFVPLTYWIDRTAYRSYQRRLARQAGKK